jgi:hypothetical protein
MINDSQTVQDHQSPLRRMVADSQGNKYEAIKTLEEAKKTPNAYLIMEGDDGGQIYLVAPIEAVKCDENTLQNLLEELDARKWDDISMARVFYEVHEPNSGITGGMGGGKAESGLWVHQEFQDLKDKIEKVIRAESASISV